MKRLSVLLALLVALVCVSEASATGFRGVAFRRAAVVVRQPVFRVRAFSAFHAPVFRFRAFHAAPLALGYSAFSAGYAAPLGVGYGCGGGSSAAAIRDEVRRELQLQQLQQQVEQLRLELRR